MNEFYRFKGHFKIETLDKNDNIIDVYEDHNFIMLPARRTISEMFTNTSHAGLKYLILGTGGTSNGTPITESNGFNKLRTSLYSEYRTLYNQNTYHIYKHEIIRVGAKYYKNLQEDGDYFLNSTNLSDTTKYLEVQKPYTYKLEVKTNVFDGDTNIAKNSDNSCVISYTTDSGDNLDNTSVTYTFEVGMSQANGQDTEREISTFNEAGMYINNRLFCMKCFNDKVKDNSTKFRITWTIIF